MISCAMNCGERSVTMSAGNSGGPAGSLLRDHALEHVDVVAGRGGDRHDLDARAAACVHASITGSSSGLPTRSTLLSATMSGCCATASPSAAASASAMPLGHAAVAVGRVDDQQHDVGVGGRSDRGLAHVAAQRAAAVLNARRIDVGDLRARRASRPGRSTVWTPRMRSRVVCGLAETATSCRPSMRLSSVDLPTLGRPTIAQKPARTSSAWHVGHGSAV